MQQLKQQDNFVCDTLASSDARLKADDIAESLLEVSDYVAAMDADELARLDRMIEYGIPCRFSESEMEYLALRLHQRNRERDSIIEQAMKESLCRTPKAL